MSLLASFSVATADKESSGPRQSTRAPIFGFWRAAGDKGQRTSSQGKLSRPARDQSIGNKGLGNCETVFESLRGASLSVCPPALRAISEFLLLTLRDPIQKLFTIVLLVTITLNHNNVLLTGSSVNFFESYNAGRKLSNTFPLISTAANHYFLLAHIHILRWLHWLDLDTSYLHTPRCLPQGIKRLFLRSHRLSTLATMSSATILETL